MHKEKIYNVSLDKIQFIYIEGYNRQQAKLPQTIIFGLVAIAELIVASNDAPAWYLFAIPPLILLPISYFTGNPDMTFEPLSDEDIRLKIILYCRFPQGLSEEQLKLLLKHYNQESVKPFKFNKYGQLAV